jgi:hypothetical protein
MVRAMRTLFPALSRPLAALSLGLLVGLASAPAAAEPPKDLAQLRQVFGEGRQLEDKGQWAEALDKFKEVAAAKVTPQVRFHIALCEENLGKLVSAKKGFELAGAEATAAGSSAIEVPPAAKEHVDAINARLGKLHIEAAAKLGASKLTLDGNAVAEAEIADDLEVDPGAHVVEVKDGSGKSTFRKEITVAEKGSEKLVIPAAAASADEAPSPISSGGSHVPAYVVGGVGLGLLALSGVFFGLRASNIATVKATCTNQVLLTGCSPADASLASQGKAFTGAADAFVVIGGAAVATGVVLYFALGPKTTSGSTASSASAAWVAPTGRGFAVGGVF